MRRRDFLKAALAARVAVAVGARGAKAGPSTLLRASRPNLLVILVDDLGYGDLSSYGAKDLRTPHIDRLVGQGMRFDRFYANCPVCSPTRAALLSGRYPELVGVPGVIRTNRGSSWGHLTKEAVLLPRVLAGAGYTSAIVGKWHLGLTSPNTPTERGFDFFHGFLGDMMDDYYHHRRQGRNYMRKNKEVLDTKGTHATDLFTTWACEYLKGQAGGKGAEGPKRPFFLYLAYNAPHGPIQPPKEWLDRVRKRESKIDAKRARLVALIEHLDDGIGKVIKTLDDAGLAGDTLVVFVSDNGGALHYGARNGATRDGKGTCYEGGIRVPMAARWPGKIKAASRSDRVGLTMDIYPTLAAAAGAGFAHEIDGVSFLETLLGRPQAEAKRDIFFGRLEGGRGGAWTTECIRRGTYKAVRPRNGQPLELYNLATDPLEKTDLAKTEPAKLAALSAALGAQLKRYKAVPWRAPK